MRRLRVIPWFALLNALVVLTACDTGDQRGVAERADAPSTASSKRPSPSAGALVARHRPAIAEALARDSRCVARACSTPSGLERRAAALAATVAPLDDALGNVATPRAKDERVATSVVRHAAQQLESCFLLSARKHGGTPTLEECRGPVAEFREAVVVLRERIARNA
jgi:hypothetical protein